MLQRRCATGIVWWRPINSNETDVLSVKWSKSAFTQSFQHCRTRAQPCLSLFTVRTGLDHYGEQQHALLLLPSFRKKIFQRRNVVKLGGAFLSTARRILLVLLLRY